MQYSTWKSMFLLCCTWKELWGYAIVVSRASKWETRCGQGPDIHNVVWEIHTNHLAWHVSCCSSFIPLHMRPLNRSDFRWWINWSLKKQELWEAAARLLLPLVNYVILRTVGSSSQDASHCDNKKKNCRELVCLFPYMMTLIQILVIHIVIAPRSRGLIDRSKLSTTPPEDQTQRSHAFSLDLRCN